MWRSCSYFVACGLAIVLGWTSMAAADDSSTVATKGGGCPCTEGECGPACQGCCSCCCGWCAGLEGTFLKATRDPSAIA